MSSASLEVQTAIFAILDADVTLSALVTGVFDDVPESYTDFPYVTLGEDVLTEFESDRVLGFRVSLTIHCWSQYKGQRETKLVQDAVYRALNQATPAVVGYNMILLRQVDQTSERDPDGMTRHGVQTFEMLIRADPTFIGSDSVLSPLFADLTAMYTMDDITAGTVADESVNNNDATVSGSVVTTPGFISNALQLSNNGANKMLTTFNLTGEWAISFRIKVNAYTGANSVIVADGAGTNGIALRGSAEATNLMHIGGSNLATGVTWGTGTYIHVVLNSESGGRFVYANNVKSGASLLSSTFNALTWGAKDNGGNAADFDLDQVRVFAGRSLTTAEITELFEEAP